MTFEGKPIVASKKETREKKLRKISLQVLKRKLFITFIRYQNVNNSMIKWASGDINWDELLLMIREEEVKIANPHLMKRKNLLTREPKFL